VTPGFMARPKLALLDVGAVELLEPLTFRSSRHWWSPKSHRHESEFRIPKGFICDLASVPHALASLAPSWDQTAGSGLLHDWLYRTGQLSRPDADALFYEALRCPPAVGRVRAWAMWAAVRAGGWSAWSRHRIREAMR
jgi:hypothetical protein